MGTVVVMPLSFRNVRGADAVAATIVQGRWTWVPQAGESRRLGLHNWGNCLGDVATGSGADRPAHQAPPGAVRARCVPVSDRA